MHYDTTPATLRQALIQALEAAPARLRVEHVDYLREPVVMVDTPEGAVLISNPYAGGLNIAVSTYSGVQACLYPAGYDPRRPHEEVEDEDIITVYETAPDNVEEAAVDLRRLVAAITARFSTPAERIAQRIAFAHALARALHLTTGEVTVEHLGQMARSVYARMAVWYGEDAALLADDADALYGEERDAHDGDSIDGEGTAAPTRFVERARRHLARSGGPTTDPYAPEQTRALFVQVLASLMHAAQSAEGDHYAIYDGQDPFHDLHQALTR